MRILFALFCILLCGYCQFAFADFIEEWVVGDTYICDGEECRIYFISEDGTQISLDCRPKPKPEPKPKSPTVSDELREIKKLLKQLTGVR